MKQQQQQPPPIRSTASNVTRLRPDAQRPPQRELDRNGAEAQAGGPAQAEAPDTSAADAHGDQERIAERAYALYLARNGEDGTAESDWFEAERQIREGNTRAN